MEKSSRARAFERSSDATARIGQWRNEWRLARSTQMDLELVRAKHLNVLVVGPEGMFRNVLAMIRADLLSPVQHREGNQPLALPAHAVGTLILRNVETLTLDEQCRLAAWIERSSGYGQVVSTTTIALWPRVEAGRFLEPLFYRLNTVHVDASA